MSTAKEPSDGPPVPACPAVKYVSLDDYSRWKLALYEEGTDGKAWLRSDTSVDDLVENVR